MQKHLITMLAIVSTLMLTGCVALFNATIPTDGYARHTNVAYGDHQRQALDVYVPTGLSKPAPVLLFFYGGSWQSGKKDYYRFVGQAFASQGFVTVIADYRLYPEVYFPEFMDDAAKALVYVHAHIGEYGGDRKNIFVAGHSAGAFNAIMLAANSDYVTRAGGKPSWIRGAIGIAGPYDFLPMTDPDIIALFSKQPSAKTQPIHYITRAMPPTFLATGDADDTVLPRNSRNVAAKMKSVGGDVALHEYPGLGHIGIVVALADGFRSKAPLLDDITAFVHRHQK